MKDGARVSRVASAIGNATSAGSPASTSTHSKPINPDAVIATSDAIKMTRSIIALNKPNVIHFGGEAR